MPCFALWTLRHEASCASWGSCVRLQGLAEEELRAAVQVQQVRYLCAIGPRLDTAC